MWKEKKINLVISLFVKIYENNKDLCSKLLDIFPNVNEGENTDWDEDLADELDTFNQIFSKADNIIEKNEYNPINFYGILFCYFIYYDKYNISKIINNFSKRNII